MRRLSAAFFASFVLFLGFSPQAEARGTVDIVDAKVISSGSLPPIVQKRMETTVTAIGTQLLAGRKLDDVMLTRARDEAVIHEVFDKVLVGYSVERVSLEPGETVKIEISLVPWTDVIRAVHVDIAVDGMPPLVEEMVRRDLASVDRVFIEGMDGLPVAASDWTNGVLKKSLNAYMEEHLPEFRADFDLEPGPEARVSLTVFPRLPVVRTIDLSMRSSTVPNLSLLNHRDQMQENVNMLIGVPVAFVERHAKEFDNYFAASLDANSEFRALKLHTVVSLTPGQDMAVMSRSDTKHYIIRLEGWTDISRRHADNRDVVFRFHAGSRFSPRDEIFLQTDFAPQAVSWRWELGYARHLFDETRFIVRYDMKEHRFIVGAEQELGRKWMLRYEYRWTDQRGEGAIRYRLHDFLSVEYAADSEDSWLRLIGNF